MPSRNAHPQDRSQRVLFFGTALLFLILLVFGGGGAPAPLMQMTLEAPAFFWLLYLLWSHWFAVPIRAEARGPALFVLAVLMVPVIHLVPLPYSLWSSLPGRDLAAEATRLAGFGEIWRPLSLIPEGTRLSALQLIPGVAIFFATYALAPEQRLRLAQVALAVIAFSALLGALQFTNSGNRSFYFFSRSDFQLPTGIFANRNFQASFLLAGVLLCALQLRLIRNAPQSRVRAPGGRTGPWADPRFIMYAIAIPFLALMALATLSRTGLLLMGPSLLLAMLVTSTSRLRRSLPIALAVIGFAAVVMFFIRLPMVETVLGRFRGADSRTEAWPELYHVASTYFPSGSGLGTFDAAFRRGESLEFLQAAYFNHAHNDYIEILIETGLIGAALVAIFLLVYLVRVLQLLRSRASSPYLWLQRVAAAGIGLLLIQSAGDYPLRTIALQSMFAFFCAILLSWEPMVPASRRGEAR